MNNDFIIRISAGAGAVRVLLPRIAPDEVT
jgi:hypothetical protein